MDDALKLFHYDCNMTVTLALAAPLLVLGHIIKLFLPLLRKFLRRTDQSAHRHKFSHL